MSLYRQFRNRTKNKHHIFSLNLIYLCLVSICFMTTTIAFSQSPSLAERVYEKYKTLLQRDDIYALLPTVFEEIKKPENQKLLNPDTINFVVDNPDQLKTFIPNIDDEFITLLKEDQEIQAFLRDSDVHALFVDIAAIDEIASIIERDRLPLAQKVHLKYETFFEREDILQILPGVLAEIRKPETQQILTPEIIKLAIDNPDQLKTVISDIDDRFITLLKEDAEVKAFISDPDVQLLLQDPAAIDKLAVILDIDISVPVLVKIVPASVESPPVGEQLIITVDIADGQNVSGYEGELEYDSTALRFVSLEHGTYLSGQVFPVPTTVENGLISFAQISVDSTADMTEGTLVTIIFEVVDAKASILTLSEVLIGGPAGVSYTVIKENGEILEPPPKTPWDANNDGRVNILDLTFVASHFGKPDAPPEADVNGDGKVNILDLTLVASHFGETT